MSVLAIAEHRRGELRPVSLEQLAAGRDLAEDLPRGEFAAVEGGHLCFVEEAAAAAPLQRWCVEQLVATIERVREELDVSGPDHERIERMADRARTHAEG